MYLGSAYAGISESQRRDSFELSPSAGTIGLPQTADFSNCRTDGNCFNFSDFANNFETHDVPAIRRSTNAVVARPADCS
jgi:hypothetical protein